MENGVTVTNHIPDGNGTNTVDQTYTNGAGITSNTRLVSNGHDGLQAWTNNSDGTAAYLSRDNSDPNTNVYAQVYNSGASTSGIPNDVVGATPDFKNLQTASVDNHGNITGNQESVRNSRGNYDTKYVDSEGNTSLYGDLPDNAGGLNHNALVGQINNDGIGWEKDSRGIYWHVTPDINGDVDDNGKPKNPLLWRTVPSQDGGTIAIYKNSSGVETRENWGKNPSDWISTDIYDPDGTVTHLGKDGSKTTLDPKTKWTTRVEFSGETFVFDKDGNLEDHKSAPGAPHVTDLPGAVDKFINVIDFWNPVERSVDKAGTHALWGLGGAIGLWDRQVPDPSLFNLPTQRSTFHAIGQQVTDLVTDSMYLRGNTLDANGNPIYSAGGNLDHTHALLNYYNDWSKLLIGTDWSQLHDKPMDTIGSAIFGIGSWVAPYAPKGLAALDEVGRAAGVLGDAEHSAIAPNMPWPEAFESPNDLSSSNGVLYIGGKPYLNLSGTLVELGPKLPGDISEILDKFATYRDMSMPSMSPEKQAEIAAGEAALADAKTMVDGEETSVATAVWGDLGADSYPRQRAAHVVGGTAKFTDPAIEAGLRELAMQWALDHGGAGDPGRFANAFEYFKIVFDDYRKSIDLSNYSDAEKKVGKLAIAIKEFDGSTADRYLSGDLDELERIGRGEVNLDPALQDDDLVLAIRQAQNLGSGDPYSGIYHPRKHEKEIPASERDFGSSRIEAYENSAALTVREGELVGYQEIESTGVRKFIFQRRDIDGVGSRPKEAIVVVQRDGTTAIASYGNVKAVKWGKDGKPPAEWKFPKRYRAFPDPEIYGPLKPMPSLPADESSMSGGRARVRSKWLLPVVPMIFPSDRSDNQRTYAGLIDTMRKSLVSPIGADLPTVKPLGLLPLPAPQKLDHSLTFNILTPTEAFSASGIETSTVLTYSAHLK